MDPAKQKPSKSVQTSVPSIAIRFHCGDEDVDIYPSADDEGDEDTTAEGATPTPSLPATPSRDSSPIKEYFKGLGKRSTSVDSSIDAAPAASASAPPPDKWRLFTELRGKITKTVEEKLTEMKAERKAAGNTPVPSGAAPGKERPRGGADQSSISDSEDVSETAPLATADGAVKEAAQLAASASKRKGWRSRSPKAAKERAEKKRSKHKQSSGGGSTTSEEECAEEGAEVEAGEEAEEEPRLSLLEDDEFEVDTTIDFRSEPPMAYFSDKRKSRLNLAPSEPAWRRVVRRCWQARWIVAGVGAMVAYAWCPLNAFANGIIIGVLLTLVTHFTVGLSGFLEPDDAGQHRPFAVPDFGSRSTLETPMEQTEAQLLSAKCAGWMNELPYVYDPETYHINNTQTVYVRLEGSTLRISHPRNKVQKRASWDERKYKMKFVHQRIYELAGCQLKLLPEGLTRRRIWSKKYPLCLVLPQYMRVSNEDLRDKIIDEMEPSLQETSSELPLADLPVVPSVPAFVLRSRSNVGTSRAAFGASRAALSSRVMVSPGGATFAKSSDEVVPVDVSFADEGCLIDSNVPTRVNSAANDGGHRIKFDVDEGREGQEGTEGNAEEDDFCVLEEMHEACLYLFARADRQKEDWYRRLTMAIRFSTASIPEERSPDASVNPVSPSVPAVPSSTVSPSAEFDYELGSLGSSELVTRKAVDVAGQRYLEFMARFPVQIPRPGFRGPPEKGEREVDCDVLWVNAMLGHVLYDLLASAHFKEKVSQKIQRKLDLIKLPYFIENLVLSDVDLGRDVPLIHRASRPVLDDHGLWVDLDVTFEGCIKLTLETKLNLMKLKVSKGPDEDAASPPSPSSPPTEGVEGEADEDSFDEEQGEELDPSQSGARDPKPAAESRSPASKPREAKAANERPTLEKGSFTERHTSTEKRPSKTSTASTVARSSSLKSAALGHQQSAMYNSEIEDSAESSETEPDAKSAPTSSGESDGTKSEASPSKTATNSGRGVMRMVNKIVASKYFQQATEYKYIKRAMEGVSKTVITLTVEIRAVSGQLAVNLPPPPSDRLWYGFRNSPGVWLKAQPKFGERSVSMHRVVSFIEKKLVEEMEKKLVLPNMDDLVIPPMTTELP